MLSGNIWSRSLHFPALFLLGLSLWGRPPTLKKYQGEKVDKPLPVPWPDVIRLFIQPFIPEQSGKGGSHRSGPPPTSPFFRTIVVNWNELMIQFDYGEFRLRPNGAGRERPTGHRRRVEGDHQRFSRGRTEKKQQRRESLESVKSWSIAVDADCYVADSRGRAECGRDTVRCTRC
jgi:hypothetical protein